jgi:putative SOS response-associated peptidase YedK
MFRDAFQRHRCIIPASGYYEWLKREDGRQPYFISSADGGVLNFTGLWDRWKSPETGEPVISCTIIVTDANALTRPIHDRMPVLLDKADVGPWLKGEAGIELLRPAAEDRLRMWPVSRRVNKLALAMTTRRFSIRFRPDLAGRTVSLTFCALYVRAGKKQVGNYRYCGGCNQQAA